MVEPELAYMPYKETDSEAMILKIVVSDIKNEIGILIGALSINIEIAHFKYVDMAQEYNETGGIKTDSTKYNLYLQYYYNLKIKDSSKVLITDDINYFRDSHKDCLYKSHDENISRVIYSKCCSSDEAWCEIDWGDGTVENIDDIISHYEDEVISYDRIAYNVQNIKYHTYSKTGEYYIKIKGRIPQLQFIRSYISSHYFEYTTPKLEEVIQWGNLHLYSISEWLRGFQWVDNEYQTIKIKMPKHISTNSFKELLSASHMFSHLDINENDISQKIFYNFVDTFPNLLDASDMFYESNISYIPMYFCYNHKNIMNCRGMFYSNPITYIGERAFANCGNLTTVNDLVYNGRKPDGTYGLPLLTKVEDGVFENDINLLDVSFAFNYVSQDSQLQLLYSDEKIGLKTVGNNIYKNCKRLRHANEPFYRQTGLISVGESLFEGCEDLINVSMCFYKCFSLQHIGDNIFKGCTKIRECNNFCYEDYLVNFPDKMLYDLKYYDYLKDVGYYNSFNGFWENIEEQNGYVINNNGVTNDLQSFLKYKNYNHDNFPTRKHSKDLFSKEYITDCVNNNVALSGLIKGNTIFNSFIQFNNKMSEHYKEIYLISNFTGDAFPIWEYPELIDKCDSLFGFRNIKVKKTYHSAVQERQEYGVSINYYDNYLDIATADPMICNVYSEGGKSYLSQNYLLDGYYLPDEYDTEYEKQEVIEFNDPIKYI